ncbi:MAG: AMP-binding protein [Verrucomicrobiaceae bacterium]|nr:AMP-binding protein [Verrucomicrobiaceae bacterium]
MKLSFNRPGWDSSRPEVWKRWQLQRLKDYLTTRIIPFSDHYRRVCQENDFRPADLHELEDWAHFPLTSKVDLTVPAEQMREFILKPDVQKLKREWRTIRTALLHGPAKAQAMLEHEFRPILLTSTTGRSSEPVPFVLTGHDIDNLNTTGRRIMECGGSEKDFRHLNCFPYAPHLAFWQTHHASIGFGTFMASTGGGKTLGTDGNLRMLQKIQPDIIIGMPTFIYHLLHEAVDRGIKVPGLKRIVLGGEKTAQGLRAKLRELAQHMGAEPHVLSTYGFTEAKMAFPECTGPTGITPTGFHLSPDLGIVEIIDPKTGELVPDGHRGEIIFTPLDARGTVVLRYRTGDIAEGGITWERCPHCGRTCPRLLGPISRVSEVRSMTLDKIKGTLVDFNVLEHLLDDQRGLAAWQIELTKRNGDPLEVDEIHLHVCPEHGLEEAEVRKMIHRKFHEATELSPNAIHFHRLEEMRDMLGVGRLMKEEKLVDRRREVASTQRI